VRSAQARRHEKVNRRDDQIERGQRHERAPPTEPLDQPVDEGKKDGAGEARHQRDRGDRRAMGAHERASEERQDGVVENESHRRPEADPGEVEGEEAVDAGAGREEERGGERADGHGQPAADPVDQSAGKGRDRGRRAEARGQGARDVGPGPALLALERADEKRENVIERAPGDELGRGQDGDGAEHPRLGLGPPAVQRGSVPRRRSASRWKMSSLLLTTMAAPATGSGSGEPPEQ
jgi:hypothetical protein